MTRADVRTGDSEVRPGPRVLRHEHRDAEGDTPAGARGRRRVQHRPVRPRDRRRPWPTGSLRLLAAPVADPDRPLIGDARRPRRRRTAPGARGLERHGPRTCRLPRPSPTCSSSRWPAAPNAARRRVRRDTSLTYAELNAPRQPARPPADRATASDPSGSSRCAAPLRRPGRRPARRGQGGRRLSAARPRLPGRPDRPHARRRGAGALVTTTPADGLPTLPAAVRRARGLRRSGPGDAASDGRGPADLTDADRPAPLRPDTPRTSSTPRAPRARPKGVVVTHTGLPGLLDIFTGATARRGARAAGSCTTCSPGFDAAFWELTMACSPGHPGGRTRRTPSTGPPALARARCPGTRSRTLRHHSRRAASCCPRAALPGRTDARRGRARACPPELVRALVRRARLDAQLVRADRDDGRAPR